MEKAQEQERIWLKEATKIRHQETKNWAKKIIKN